MAGTRPLVAVEGLRKGFGAGSVLNDLSLDIAENSFFALLGPSGCGKTTLLRCLAGLETPDAGRVLVDGEEMGGRPPHRRPVNMMFQSYALFPHMSVGANIAFGLRQERRPAREITERVAEAVALLDLAGLEARRPDTLSGGQRQRVALARALVKRPKLLLLDEPLAALDRQLRETTQFELKRLQRRLGTTFVLVTHDQREAMVMADTIAVMRAGQIEQIGPPEIVYRQPASRWLATFMGDANILDGDLVSVDAGTCRVRTALGMLVVAACSEHEAPPARVALALRPERIKLAPASSADQANAMIDEVAFTGEAVLYTVRRPDGATLRAALRDDGTAPFAAGAPVSLEIAPGAASLLLR